MTVNEIMKLSRFQITRALDEGSVTAAELKNAYSTLRHRAQQRERVLQSKEVKEEFDINRPKETFTKPSNLVTEGKIVEALADVNQYLNRQQTTITGLRKHQKNVINAAKYFGFKIGSADYKEFSKFMNWFHASEYAKKYDSGAKEVAQVYNSTKASPADWKKAFEEFKHNAGNSSPVRKY